MILRASFHHFVFSVQKMNSPEIVHIFQIEENLQRVTHPPRPDITTSQFITTRRFITTRPLHDPTHKPDTNLQQQIPRNINGQFLHCLFGSI